MPFPTEKYYFIVHQPVFSTPASTPVDNTLYAHQTPGTSVLHQVTGPGGHKRTFQVHGIAAHNQFNIEIMKTAQCKNYGRIKGVLVEGFHQWAKENAQDGLKVGVYDFRVEVNGARVLGGGLHVGIGGWSRTISGMWWRWKFPETRHNSSR
ncbi:hypothetical protein BU23DRAFT_570451 [Bimuria novae-zelandiae CBS 107.79]|uniref:Uncharacterized protein n=1 Tax=Bimuria novae-zelandiae CBS 107.79 TaxID=1447943 RepID=A0A6A5V3X7_9PLEO|nr:hypothetical protein BU23DRAFT_570451 [Bimuria novae-zelandiae CBS 107.79]